MLAATGATGTAACAIMAVGMTMVMGMLMRMVVGVVMAMQMLVVMGMCMVVGVLVVVLMGMGYTIVGVLMGVRMGMFMGVSAATNMIVMDMHSIFSFMLFFNYTELRPICQQKGRGDAPPLWIILQACCRRTAPRRSCFQ